MGRLCGWRRPATTGEPAKAGRSGALEEISLAAASQLPAAQEFPVLPWAVCRHAVAKMAAGCAYSSGRAVVVIGDPAVAGPLRMHALAPTETGAPDWVAVKEALAAMLALHHAREFFAPPVFPEEFGTKLFAPLGFAREPLSQFLMQREP